MVLKYDVGYYTLNHNRLIFRDASSLTVIECQRLSPVSRKVVRCTNLATWGGVELSGNIHPKAVQPMFITSNETS